MKIQPRSEVAADGREGSRKQPAVDKTSDSRLNSSAASRYRLAGKTSLLSYDFGTISFVSFPDRNFSTFFVLDIELYTLPGKMITLRPSLKSCIVSRCAPSLIHRPVSGQKTEVKGEQDGEFRVLQILPEKSKQWVQRPPPKFRYVSMCPSCMQPLSLFPILVLILIHLLLSQSKHDTKRPVSKVFPQQGMDTSLACSSCLPSSRGTTSNPHGIH